MTRLPLCLLAACLTATPALANGADVNIVTPPQQEQYVPEQQPAERRAASPVIVNVQVAVAVRPANSRYRRVDRQLFRRWTGFIRQYSGRRYPF